MNFKSFEPGKKNIKWFFLAALSVSLLLIQGNALAHAPSNLSMDYDEAEQSLEVTVTHTVSDPTDHYIERIEVTRNGELIIDEDYNEQPSDSTFTYSYDIETTSGDTLQAEAFCNRFGTLTGTLEISGDNGTPNDGDGGTPWMLIGGAIIAVVVIIGLIVAYTRR